MNPFQETQLLAKLSSQFDSPEKYMNHLLLLLLLPITFSSKFQNPCLQPDLPSFSLFTYWVIVTPELPCFVPVGFWSLLLLQKSHCCARNLLSPYLAPIMWKGIPAFVVWDISLTCLSIISGTIELLATGTIPILSQLSSEAYWNPPSDAVLLSV